MFIRYSIEIYGNFNPDIVIPLLNIDDFSVIEKSFDIEDNSGLIFLLNKKEFAIYYDREYESSYINFFDLNYESLKENGANDFRIFIEAYYSDQCNFEIFDKNLLSKLAVYNVSFPISVYYVNPENNKIEF